VLLFIQIFKAFFTFGFSTNNQRNTITRVERNWVCKATKRLSEDCLMHVLSKNDVIAILPTGYGKSLIFQLAPFAFCSIISTGAWNKLFKVL
jgi:hypothetical protein